MFFFVCRKDNTGAVGHAHITEVTKHLFCFVILYSLRSELQKLCIQKSRNGLEFGTKGVLTYPALCLITWMHLTWQVYEMKSLRNVQCILDYFFIGICFCSHFLVRKKSEGNRFMIYNSKVGSVNRESMATNIPCLSSWCTWRADLQAGRWRAAPWGWWESCLYSYSSCCCWYLWWWWCWAKGRRRHCWRWWCLRGRRRCCPYP